MENVLVISRNTDAQLHKSVEECIIKIIREYENKDYAYTLSLNARIFDIIVLVCRSIGPEAKKTGFHGEKKNIAYLKKIYKTFEYIEKNYSSAITLKDVSKVAGFSEFCFSRLFQELGAEFSNYLSSYRIK